VADQLIPLYPTQLLRRRFPEMEETNRQLAALIKSIEASEPNADDGTTTEGGYQTSAELLKRDHPALNIVKKHIGESVQAYADLLIRQECSVQPSRVEFILWGWAVVLRAGNTQGLHVHPEAHISGVYYVSAPAPALQKGQDDGKISFYDPRPRANMNQLVRQITRHRESPVPGDMVLFPSWLEHSVASFQGPGERICIAFNARLVMS
jgi:uncharacterized protein (TIGR02466 family)